MGKTIVLISSKGGSGKSTITIGLATALSRAGKSVLLIDADEGARCLDTMLSVNVETVFDISDVVCGNCVVDDAIIKVPSLNNVFVIPSPLRATPLDLTALGELTESMNKIYDYVIVDTKGQLSSDIVSKIGSSAQYIAVVSTDKIAIRNTGILCSELYRLGINCRLIINRFRTHEMDGTLNNVDNIVDESCARLIGIVPEDAKVTISANRPLVLGTAAAAIFRIASRIDGNNVSLVKIKKII